MVYMPIRDSGACGKNKELVMKMNAEGRSLAEIARTVGTTGHRVHDFLRRNGVTRQFPTSFRGEDCHKWKGGRFVDHEGYVWVYCGPHPYGKKPDMRHIKEHRLVMEKHLGRYLKPNEVVHHKNGIRDDNRLENLELFDANSKHLKHELTGRVPKWTENGSKRIREGALRGSRVAAEILRSKNRTQSKSNAGP